MKKIYTILILVSLAGCGKKKTVEQVQQVKPDTTKLDSLGNGDIAKANLK